VGGAWSIVIARSEAPRVAGFVLAGGASRRFGSDKALAEIGGEAVISRLCAVLLGAAASVVIIGAVETYSRFGVPCVADRWPGEGPLGGIITGLTAGPLPDAELAGMPFEGQGKPALPSEDRLNTGAKWNLIVGCDMPFLTREWLAYMAQRAMASNAEVVVPRSAHGLEPLCACWRTSAIASLTRSFNGGVRRVTEAMKQLSMEVLDAADWKRFDNAGRLFWNMNTPADYDEAKRILEAERT
jgi:molybdopterin-guanine dinucleotide biosynthesis protein A